jgi:signal transduction histidine kinase
MRRKMNALSIKYELGLTNHLRGRKGSAKSAASVGVEAVALGLETLDLAKIHERALLHALTRPNSVADRGRLTKRAEGFFIEAIAPIERTHLAAAAAIVESNTLAGVLQTRDGELALSKRNVKAGIRQRKAAELNFRSKEKHFAKLLKESRSLQSDLRKLAYELLAAHENHRDQLSRGLHDDIAQLLLAINVRLLTLERQLTGDATNLLTDIARTVRLVKESSLRMREVTRELGKPNESKT